MALSKYQYPWVADDRYVDAEFVVRSFRDEYKKEQERREKTKKFQEKLAAAIFGRNSAARFRTKCEIEFDSGQAWSEPSSWDAGTEVWITGITDYGAFNVRVGSPDDPPTRNVYEAQLDWEEVANDLEPIE